MRFFAVTAFATLAFGLLSSAAPTPVKAEGNGKLDVRTKLDVRDAGLLDVKLGVKLRSDEEPKGLDSVLSDVVDAVTPIVKKITDLETVECTVEILEPILKDVKGILEAAIKAVEHLLTLPVDEALKSATTGLLIDVKDLAKLVAAVIRVVICLIQAVLAIVSGVVKDGVLPLLCEIGELLGNLLSLVVKLVSTLLKGLVAEVLLLIADLVKVILGLDLKVVIQVLGLKVTV